MKMPARGSHHRINEGPIAWKLPIFDETNKVVCVYFPDCQRVSTQQSCEVQMPALYLFADHQQR